MTDVTQADQSSIALRGAINRLGGLSASAYAAHTLLSFVLAARLPVGSNATEGTVLLDLAGANAPSGTLLARWAAGEFPSIAIAAAAYLAPLLIATALFARLCVVLVRHGDSIDPQSVSLLLKWTVVFGVIATLAMPVIVEDFWLSLAWGRLAAEGINPYYESVRAAHVQGLPIAGTGLMTYGPLWASISAVVAAISFDRAWIAAILFKLILLAAWLVMVRATAAAAAVAGRRRQALAVAVTGWLPLGVHLGVAEGHNDVVMTAGVALWAYACTRGRRWSTAMITATAAIKYVTAPIVAADMLRWLRAARDLRPYVVQTMSALLVVVIAFGPWFRSVAFFRPARAMRDWHFWRPEDAIRFLVGEVGLPTAWVSIAVKVLLGVACGIAAWRYARDKDNSTRLFELGLVLLATVLFASVGHVWPWFVIWLIPFAALTAESHWGRLTLGIALFAPFVILPWSFGVASPRLRFDWMSVAWYSAAALWWRFGPVSHRRVRFRAS